MNVLIGCECSGTIRDAFREKGHDAWSCDLKPCEKNSEHHLRMDIYKAINTRDWDFIGLHPDCTAMAVSGNRWYGKGMPNHHNRLISLAWTKELWNKVKSVTEKAYLENPVSVIFSHIGASQYIQPWQFGHGETKKTGLALHGLPKLKPTNIVEGREARIHKMPPSPNRKTDRSRTYQGIADAMAEQWG